MRRAHEAELVGSRVVPGSLYVTCFQELCLLEPCAGNYELFLETEMEEEASIALSTTSYQLQKKPLPKRCGPRTASSRSLPCSLALLKVTHDDKRPFSFHMSNEFKPCWDFSRATEETITDLNMQVGTQCANKQLNNEPGQTWQELQDIYLAALAVSTF